MRTVPRRTSPTGTSVGRRSLATTQSADLSSAALRRSGGRAGPRDRTPTTTVRRVRAKTVNTSPALQVRDSNPECPVNSRVCYHYTNLECPEQESNLRAPGFNRMLYH